MDNKTERAVLSESDALDTLRRNRIEIKYPKIILPKSGPGLACWRAIDTLCNRVKPAYFTQGYPRTQEVKP